MKKRTKMNPEEFAEKMKELSERQSKWGGCDTEWNHTDMDELMCSVLSDLGYGEGVEIFRNTYKWYA